METIILTILIFTILLSAAFLLLYFWFHDYRIKNKSLDYFASTNPKTNVLFIYPHPDDETMISGGLISKMTNDQRFSVFAISTSHGEKGNEFRPDLNAPELGELRKKEFEGAMKSLGVKNFEMWNFKDGEHDDQSFEIARQISNFLVKNNIDLVITYEKHGLYGHPDHIVVSKVITDIINSKIRLVYATLPNKILRRINLPKTITIDGKVINLTVEKILDPEFKVDVRLGLWKKYRAASHYKSQNIGQGKPIWFVVGMMGYEYYAEFFKQ
jgi:N-acetylglucosamine malate deacetylase 2